MSNEEFDFGTEPHKLHRKDSIGTSVEAAYSVDTTNLEKMVFNEIKRYPNGAIADDILAAFPGYPYSSITARFSALIRSNLIHRDGTKRKGKSGRDQSVMKVGANPNSPTVRERSDELNNNGLQPCPWCSSRIGPFFSCPDGKPQVICSTCGARGPYRVDGRTAQDQWNDLEVKHGAS